MGKRWGIRAVKTASDIIELFGIIPKKNINTSKKYFMVLRSDIVNEICKEDKGENTELMKRLKRELRRLQIYYKIGSHLKIKDKAITKKLLNQPVRTIPSLSDEMVKWIESGKPMLLARLGGTEGRVAGEYCEKKLGLRKHYSQDVCNWLYTTSGFFADDYENKEVAMDEYAELTIDGIKYCDYLSAMFPTKIYMPFFFKYYAKNAVATFSDFGPYFETPIENTWVKALVDKKVLVINSFSDSIEFQYKRKSELVKSKEYELPAFELITYKTMVTQCDERPNGYKNFFEVYNKMLEDIKQIDFDIALIGAGAYGFPLAVEIKKMGKIAIETCGSTPLFFGVYGERNLREGVGKHMTDAWIRPIEEKPKRYKEIEGGCYW